MMSGRNIRESWVPEPDVSARLSGDESCRPHTQLQLWSGLDVMVGASSNNRFLFWSGAAQ
jgi:hypothetical protein